MTPDQFRQARQRLGLSQAQLAARLRVDPRSVRRWEAGDRKISGTVEALLKMLKKATPD